MTLISESPPGVLACVLPEFRPAGRIILSCSIDSFLMKDVTVCGISGRRHRTNGPGWGRQPWTMNRSRWRSFDMG